MCKKQKISYQVTLANVTQSNETKSVFIWRVMSSFIYLFLPL